MSSVNLYAKEISVKIVYYGPGLGGKTSSLQFIHGTIKPDSRGQLVSLATGVDRTLYFDFLPIKLPKLRGFTVRVQLYTVPGQVHYNSTRKLVITGADGVVFVADSQKARREANVESLANLRENLEEQGVSLEKLPLVLQYNKRDLPEILTLPQLEAELNPRRMPFFETCATSGRGVFEALKSVTTLALSDLRRRGVWRSETVTTADGVPVMEMRDEPSDPGARTPTTEGSKLYEPMVSHPTPSRRITAPVSASIARAPAASARSTISLDSIEEWMSSSTSVSAAVSRAVSTSAS